MKPRRITMLREASAADAHSTVKDQVAELYEDFENEAKREVHDSLASTQGDLPVRKHINGLAITFFVLIGLLLSIWVAGYAIYAHH
jgi:hypothetical protein